MTHEPQPTPYDWAEFRRKWERDEMTTEQAVGQLIVWGERHEAQLLALTRELEGYDHALADHDARLQGVEGRSE